MSSIDEKGFLGVGGTAAGAGLASALVSLAMPVVPLFVPLLGGVAALVGLKLSGALDKPDTVLVEPRAESVDS